MKLNMKFFLSMIILLVFPVLTSGNEWQPISRQYGNIITKVGIDGNAKNLFSITSSGDFYVSNDGADSWARVQDSRATSSAVFITGTPSTIVRSVYDYSPVNEYRTNILVSHGDLSSWTELLNPIIPDKTICNFIAIGLEKYCVGESYSSDLVNIWSLSDSGNSWQTILSDDTQVGRGLVGYENFSQDGVSGVFYLNTNDGLYKSVDNGTNWRKANNKGLKVHAPPYYDSPYFVKADPTVTGLLFLGISNKLYKSINGGDSWKKIYSQLLPADIISNEGVVYLASDKGIFKSADLGDHWININKSYGRAYSLAIDPNDPSRIYAGTDQGIIISEDSGNTWMLSNTGINQNITSYICDALDEAICHMFTENRLDNTSPFTGYILNHYKSIDNGSSWSKIDFKRNNIGRLFYVAGNILIGVGSEDGYLWGSFDGGEKWKRMMPKPMGFISELYVNKNNPKTIYAMLFKDVKYEYFVGYSGTKAESSSRVYSLNVSNNSGKSWKTLYRYEPTIQSKPYDIDQKLYFPSELPGRSGRVGIDVSNQNKIYFCNDIFSPEYSGIPKILNRNNSVNLRLTRNAGEYWEKIQVPPESESCTNLAYDAKTDTLLYFDKRLKKLFKLTDFGTKWTAIYESESISSMIFDPATSSIYLSIPGKGIIQSIDNGDTWSEVNSGLPSLNTGFLSTIIKQGMPSIITTTDGVVYRLN